MENSKILLAPTELVIMATSDDEAMAVRFDISKYINEMTQTQYENLSHDHILGSDEWCRALVMAHSEVPQVKMFLAYIELNILTTSTGFKASISTELLHDFLNSHRRDLLSASSNNKYLSACSYMDLATGTYWNPLLEKSVNGTLGSFTLSIGDRCKYIDLQDCFLEPMATPVNGTTKLVVYVPQKYKPALVNFNGNDCIEFWKWAKTQQYVQVAGIYSIPNLGDSPEYGVILDSDPEFFELEFLLTYKNEEEATTHSKCPVTLNFETSSALDKALNQQCLIFF